MSRRGAEKKMDKLEEPSIKKRKAKKQKAEKKEKKN